MPSAAAPVPDPTPHPDQAACSPWRSALRRRSDTHIVARAGRMLKRILPFFCTHSPNRATSTAHELDSAQVTPACLNPPPRDTNCETRPPASTGSVDPQIKRFGLAAPPDPRAEHVHSPLLWSSNIFVRCPRAAAAQFDVFTSWSDPPRLSFTSGQRCIPPAASTSNCPPSCTPTPAHESGPEPLPEAS
jgi:hypothetical protein